MGLHTTRVVEGGYALQVYSFSWQSKAVPALIQYDGGLLDGKSTCVTRFVLMPVVLSVPARTEVLYTGAE